MPQNVAKQPLQSTPREGGFVRVMLPRALPTLLDYAVKTQAHVGSWVEAPLGNKQCTGLVVEVLAESAYQKVKTATVQTEVPPLPAQSLAFLRWVGRYTLSSPGEPLRAGLPKGAIPKQPTPPLRFVWQDGQDVKLTSAREKVRETLLQGGVFETQSQLAAAAGVSTAVVKGLLDAKAIGTCVQSTAPFAPHLATLNAEQTAASQAISQAEAFQPFLLDGVTGSGKTEVYFHSIAHILARHRTAQTLVLLPEIALTAQWLSRFEETFGVKPLVWHANITDAQRTRAWWQVLQGEPCVVVGARSALFLPFANLKLVIVDEEHDPSYKQDEGFRYHGRDMAVALAHHWQAPVVLASATPSLESWQHGLTGKYTRLHLTKRYSKQALPQVKLVDLRQNTDNKAKKATAGLISSQTLGALQATLDRGEQALLFLNRRGNAPLLLCQKCGHRRDCSRCSASMTVHGDKLFCHHCGLTEPWPESCPKCGEGSEEETPWKAYGPGTRSLFLELSEKLPNARIVVADSDAITTPNQQKELVERIQNHDVDIIIGTQMMTKGYHFPLLTCVAVMDGDMGLAHGDVRAAEKTFQSLVQVGGRAGREKTGEVLIQTHQPQHPLFQALKRYDRDGFYTEELKNRQEWGDPPFGRQVALILSGEDERMVQQAAQTLVAQAPQHKAVVVLGPAPAPLAKIRDKYRYRVLVKSALPLQGFVKGWVEAVSLPHKVRVVVDVDPQSFV